MTMEEAVTKRLNKRAASLGPKNDEILTPPGVRHGYKALGVEPVQLLYFTDRHYNPADELRIAYQRPRDCLRLGNSAQMNPCGF